MKSFLSRHQVSFVLRGKGSEVLASLALLGHITQLLVLRKRNW